MTPGENDSTDPGRAASDAVEVGTARVAEALGSGIRTSLRNNATAYGYSVTITATFGLVSVHAREKSELTILLFAGGAALAFLLVDIVASQWFRVLSGLESAREVLIGGALDVVAVIVSVGVAAGLARVPEIAVWALAPFGATVIYLVVSGLDALVARRLSGDTG